MGGRLPSLYRVLLFLAQTACLLKEQGTKATKVAFKDCGSSAKVGFVDVSPCNGGPQSCNIYYGTNASIVIDFTPGSSQPGLTAEFAYLAYGAVVVVPLNDSNACHHGVTCPLPAGRLQNFTYTVFVSDTFPQFSVVVRWKLEGSSSVPVVCIEVNISIVGSRRRPMLDWYKEEPPIKQRL